MVIGLSSSGTHSLHSSVSHTCNTFRSVKLLIERGTRVSALPRRSNFFKPARFPTLLGKVVNWLFGRNMLSSEESLPRDVGSLPILLSQTHNDRSEQSFCRVSGSCLSLLSQMLNSISLSRFPIDSGMSLTALLSRFRNSREVRFPIESGRLIRLLQLRHKTFNEASFPIEFGTVAN